MQRVITLEKKDFPVFSVLKDMSQIMCKNNFIEGVEHVDPYTFATTKELIKLDEKIREFDHCLQTIKMNAQWKLQPWVVAKFETCCKDTAEVWFIVRHRATVEKSLTNAELLRIKHLLQLILETAKDTINELDMRDLSEEYIQDTVDTKIRVDKLTNQFNKEMRQYLAERGFFGQMKKLCSRIFKTKRGENG